MKIGRVLVASVLFAFAGSVASAATCTGLDRDISITEATSCLAKDNPADSGDNNIGNGPNDPFLDAFPNYVEIDDTSGTGPYLSGDTGSGLSGKITVSGDLSMYESLALGLKFGNPANIIWGVFAIDGTGMFNWSSTGKNDLSHTVLYGVKGDKPPPEIPLPAAGFLLLAGLGGLAMVRRRK